jgi:hypothetical protein
MKKTEMDRALARMEDSTGAYRILVGKPEGRKTLGRPRLRWENTIKMDFSDVEWWHMLDVSGSVYGQVAGSCECGDEPCGSIKYGVC